MTLDPTHLDRLHDLVLPPTVPGWPSAPGWYVVFALLALAGVAMAWTSWKRWRANAYRRAALRELASLENAPAMAALLRRTALAIVPRTEIAAMTGSVWVDWLAAQYGETMPETVRTQLTAGVYGRAAQHELGVLRDYAAGWIARHLVVCHNIRRLD
ncbi:MAG: DUF4381 domain-containing protein [Anaerolineales bacterium]|nr:DUF4381 domain-containing protein [Anaerolineales bacterium]